MASAVGLEPEPYLEPEPELELEPEPEPELVPEPELEPDPELELELEPNFQCLSQSHSQSQSRAFTPPAFRVLASSLTWPVLHRWWSDKLWELCLPPLILRPLVWGQLNSSCKRRHSNNPCWWLIDCSVARPISIDKMTFWCCCSGCFALALELFVFFFFTPSVFSSFWFDRRRLIELDGESNDVPDVCGGALQVQAWRMWMQPAARPRHTPGARLQLLEEMQLWPMLPTGSRWFPQPAVIWTDCCHQPGCGPHCLQRSEHFYASQHSPSHPGPR